MSMVERIVATDIALALIEGLTLKHGPLMLYQPTACRDDGPANCLPQGEFIVGTADLLLGKVGGCDFYITEAQYEYWQYNQLIVDVTKDGGSLHARSRLYSTEEWTALSLKPLH